MDLPSGMGVYYASSPGAGTFRHLVGKSMLHITLPVKTRVSPHPRTSRRPAHWLRPNGPTAYTEICLTLR